MTNLQEIFAGVYNGAVLTRKELRVIDKRVARIIILANKCYANHDRDILSNLNQEISGLEEVLKLSLKNRLDNRKLGIVLNMGGRKEI